MSSIEDKILEIHRGGKIEVNPKTPAKNKKDLSLIYTPGVAKPCMEIYKNKSLVYEYTSKGNSVAIVTDGSAVLGLGNIGPEAALPVMEGKAVIFKEFANINAYPICLKTQDMEEIIQTVHYISPVFGGINLEDISAPRCFEIEKRLKAELDIPVFHDDQHGTAIVTLAALKNALKVVKKDISEVEVVVSGAGAAGIAVSILLIGAGVKDVILVDSTGILYHGREENMNFAKEDILSITNKHGIKGSLEDAVKGKDVFIGVSAAGLLSKDMVRSMKNPIIFAMANPDPEIMPEDAYEAGAQVVATGRSDYPNQVNNALVFPGIFRAALDMRLQIDYSMKLAAADAIASMVKKPTKKKIVPDIFAKNLVKKIVEAVKATRCN
ncbi:MAG: NADP-dependent malic enzyme [Nanoarchaeota archaeon]|nr:NADP-dependent malic enzyme [Nanoarchaeota archaeon]